MVGDDTITAISPMVDDAGTSSWSPLKPKGTVGERRVLGFVRDTEINSCSFFLYELNTFFHKF